MYYYALSQLDLRMLHWNYKTALATFLALSMSFPSLGGTVAFAEAPDSRSIDGSENNLSNPDWGLAGTQFLRKTTVGYADGIAAPIDVDAPNPRTISNAVNAQIHSVLNDRNLSDFIWAWGQFVDHDMSLSETIVPTEDFSIRIPTGEPLFDPFSTGRQKIPLARSAYDHATGTSIENPRQQVNSITSFLDASQVYGTDAVRAAALRSFLGGKLKTSEGNLLPFNVDHLPNAMSTSSAFFLSGDVRANEQPTLIALHTLFLREHNRIAEELTQDHPEWTDEEIYQGARNIVIAEINSVTYNEFLPALLGSSAVPAYAGYASDVNPGIENAFAGAGFRIGHTMISPTILRLNESGSIIPQGNLSMLQSFFNTSVITNDGIEPIMRGLSAQAMQEIDPYVIGDLRNFLFGPPGAGGMDLASINIQRGRDHGLPSYNEARRNYGLQPRTDFSEITSNAQVAERLRLTYDSNIEKVDLWIGGLAEDHLPESSVGEIFTRILVDQFRRTRDGDRFWYEHVMGPSEIAEIKATRLSDIIKRNSEVVSLQRNVFYLSGYATDEVDLSITQTSPALTVSPDAITLNVVVTNNGVRSSTGIVLTEIVPDGLSLSASGSTLSCSQTANVVTCDSFGLESGSSSSFIMRFSVESQEICASAVSIAGSVTGLEEDSMENDNTVISSTYFSCPNESDVQLTPTVSVASSVLRGFSTDVTIGATNTGPGLAENVFLSLPLPSDFTLQSGSACNQTGATVLCGPFALATGAVQIFTLPFDTNPTMPCPARREIIATVRSDNLDYFPQDDTFSAAVISVDCAPEANLGVSLAGPSTSERGTPMVFTVTASNAGPATTHRAMTRLPIEAGMTFLPTQSSEECAQNGSDIECMTSLAPTASKIFSVTFQSMVTMECATVITAHANISTTGMTELDPSDNQASAVLVTMLCPPHDADGSSEPGATTTALDDADRRTSHTSSHRGNGVQEATHALAFIARNHGMDVSMTERNHLVASATTTDVPLSGDAESIAEHDLDIICSMKRYLHQSPERRMAENLTDWTVDKLSRMLGYQARLIRTALTDESTCGNRL